MKKNLIHKVNMFCMLTVLCFLCSGLFASTTTQAAKTVTKKISKGKISAKKGTYSVNTKTKVITLKKSGTYTLSGNVGSYRIEILKKNLKVSVNLKNVTAKCSNTSFLFSSQSSTTLTLNSPAKSKTTITGPSRYTKKLSGKIPEGVIHCAGHVNLKGSGQMTIQDASQTGDAVYSGKTLTMVSGKVTATGKMASLHGTSLVIKGGTLMARSRDTALKASGTVTIRGGSIQVVSVDKGIQGKRGVSISGGTIDVKTIKSSDPKFEDFRGITAGVSGNNGKKPVTGSITITGGTFFINSYGDCIHAANNVTIKGGTFHLVSVSDDGVQAKAALTVTGTAKFTFNVKGKKLKGQTKNVAATVSK